MNTITKMCTCKCTKNTKPACYYCLRDVGKCPHTKICQGCKKLEMDCKCSPKEKK